MRGHGSQGGGAVVEMSNDDICLIHCFDNIAYMARSEEGGDLPICKFTTGEYHIEGDLVLASKERLYMYFKNCINILKLSEKLTVFFLSPLPCYLYKSPAVLASTMLQTHGRRILRRG
jgi:hypothetical protein